VGFNESFDTTAIAEQKMSDFEANRMNLMRTWMSGSSINGSQWSTWTSHHLPSDAYLPGVSLDTQHTYAGADVAWRLDSTNPCLFSDWSQGGIPVEPNTTYRVSARVMLSGITGPASSGAYGFVIKQAQWLGTDCSWRAADRDHGSGQGIAWSTVTGTYDGLRTTLPELPHRPGRMPRRGGLSTSGFLPRATNQ
jgi:hypothetical protein